MKKDERSLFEVIYDVFGYAPGGGMREVGTITFEVNDKLVTRKSYFVTIKPQPQDPDFRVKMVELNRLILSKTLACKVVLLAEIMGEEKIIDNVP